MAIEKTRTAQIGTCRKGASNFCNISCRISPLPQPVLQRRLLLKNEHQALRAWWSHLASTWTKAPSPLRLHLTIGRSFRRDNHLKQSPKHCARIVVRVAQAAAD